MTAPFDWAELELDLRVRSLRGTCKYAAAYLRTRIEAAFVPVEENERQFVEFEMARRHDVARAEAAEAENARLREALECLAQPRVMEWEECRDIARQALGGEHAQ